MLGHYSHSSEVVCDWIVSFHSRECSTDSSTRYMDTFAGIIMLELVLHVAACVDSAMIGASSVPLQAMYYTDNKGGAAVTRSNVRPCCICGIRTAAVVHCTHVFLVGMTVQVNSGNVCGKLKQLVCTFACVRALCKDLSWARACTLPVWGFRVIMRPPTHFGARHDCDHTSLPCHRACTLSE